MQPLIPTLPTTTLPDYFFWPRENRKYLYEISLDGLTTCNELIGQQGLADGSGKSDTLIYKAGNWCLKTSLKRYFVSKEDGRQALVKMSQKKTALEHLLPPKTLLVLQPENESSYWFWTITPWYKTLRSLMVEATETKNEYVLAAALQAFARATIEVIVISSKNDLSIDIHPSNFALPDYNNSNKINLQNYERVVYLDDDILEKANCLTLGYALLKRIDEFEKWQKAIGIYMLTIEDAILTNVFQKDIKKLHLENAFQDVPVRSLLAQNFAKHIISILNQCKECT